MRTFKDNTLAYYFIIALLLCSIIPHLEIWNDHSVNVDGILTVGVFIYDIYVLLLNGVTWVTQLVRIPHFSSNCGHVTHE